MASYAYLLLWVEQMCAHVCGVIHSEKQVEWSIQFIYVAFVIKMYLADCVARCVKIEKLLQLNKTFEKTRVEVLQKFFLPVGCCKPHQKVYGTMRTNEFTLEPEPRPLR